MEIVSFTIMSAEQNSSLAVSFETSQLSWTLECAALMTTFHVAKAERLLKREDANHGTSPSLSTRAL